MTGRGLIVGSSVSHRDASLSELEAATVESDAAAVTQLLAEPGVDEAFVLQTCNRVETYVVAPDAETGRAALDSFQSAPSAREMGHEESIRHLLRVAAGLESLVVGEDQILGQVRAAYELARDEDAVGPVLDDAVTKALRVGERARTETAINDGVVSIASAAVKLAEETHGLANTTAAVVGAGEMGSLAAEHLDGAVDRLVLANRTVSRAERLGESLDAGTTTVEVTGLEDLAATLAGCDIVISATGSSERVLEPAACRRLGETFVVDITRPRDIPQAADEMDNLRVYDLDKLEAVTEKTRQMRQEAAASVEAIVDEEFDRLLSQYKRKRADTVISSMYESAERIKADELETAFAHAEFDEEQRAVVEAMADAIVNQLLAAPTNSLRDAAEDDDWSTIHTALQLFDPNLDDAPAFVEEMDFGEMDFDQMPDSVKQQLLTGLEADD